MFWNRRSAWKNQSRVLLFCLTLYVIFVVLMSLGENPLSVSSEWFLPIGYLSVLLTTVLVVKVVDRKSLAWVGLGIHRHMPRELLSGIALGIGMTVVVWVPTALLGSVEFGTTNIVATFLPSVLLTFLTATGEEILFRGYIYQRVVEMLGPIAATVLFSGLFAFGHMGNPGASIISGINVFLAGILFSVCWFITGSLWTSIALHGTWNVVLGLFFGAPVSGITFPAAFLHTTAIEPIIITGGIYGPEGGIITTVVLIMAGIALYKIPAVRFSPYTFSKIFWNHYTRTTLLKQRHRTENSR